MRDLGLNWRPLITSYTLNSFLDSLGCVVETLEQVNLACRIETDDGHLDIGKSTEDIMFEIGG